MFVEAVVTHEELRSLFATALPLKIVLDETDGSHSLALEEITELVLSPNQGARLTCSAVLRWPLLGIDAPLHLRSLRILLVPEVAPSSTGEALTFRAALEHLGISGVPGALDDAISLAINARLAARHLELSWDFSRTFACTVPLPKLLEPLASLSTSAAWGKVKITEEALVFAISVHNVLARRDDAKDAAPPVRHALPRNPSPAPTVEEPLAMAPASAAAALATIALFGLAGIAAFFTVRSAAARW